MPQETVYDVVSLVANEYFERRNTERISIREYALKPSELAVAARLQYEPKHP